MDIVREDPPEKMGGGRQPSGHWVEITGKLKADPGSWYKISDGIKNPTLAHRIRTGGLRAFRPTGAFEATTRKQDDAWTTWARYVGNGSEG